MTNKLFEKLKAAKSKEELSELLGDGVAKISVEDLDGVVGGSEETDKESQIKIVRTLMEQGNYEWAWAFIEYYFGYPESEAKIMIQRYGNVNALLLVLDKLS